MVVSLREITRSGVLKAIEECDRLGRDAFLAKYGFRPARAYFLVYEGRRYDSKAIAGAAHGFDVPDAGPLRWDDFVGGEATVQRKLEELHFDVVVDPEAPTTVAVLERTSARLTPGAIYTRKQLAEQFAITDATLNTGVFQPKGSSSVWLFVTEHKSPDRTQYEDRLDGDVLYWQGQTQGRTDDLIIDHEARNLELLVFYRREKYEHDGAGFRYEGRFRYVDHEETGPEQPTRFHLVREGTASGRSTRRRYWAIVANPDRYRVEQAVAERSDDLWTVKRGDVHAGDRVAIWQAKGSGDRRGVVALGEVLTNPAELDDEAQALPYWVDHAGAGRQRRVRVRYVRPPRAPLWLTDEAPAGVLADLSVARATGGGVYRIEPEQWDRLVEALGGWPSGVDEENVVIEAVATAQARARGQGFAVSPEERTAVEQHAMRRAVDHFTAEGFGVEVVGKPFDLRCTRGDEVLYVEVKGTTTDGAEVLLTPNEVAFARAHRECMALFVCAGVEVRGEGSSIEVVGGRVRLHRPWRIDDGVLSPLGFSYSLPQT